MLTPAKINLFLRITGRRSDGYHELDSVFLPVSLYDRITLEARAAPASEVSLRCNWADLPLDGRNLALRAATLFLDQTGLRWRVRINLHKEIPAAAGLGGGSSDAGAVLRLMAQRARIEVPALAAAALRLGADVPFFLDPRPARIGGVGERITDIASRFDLHLVIGVPPIAVPTAEIYRYLKRADWSGPGPEALPALVDADAAAAGLLVNDLERPALARYPQIGEVKVLLKHLGAAEALMSGSGGAVFGIFQDPARAVQAAAAARRRMPQGRFFAARIAPRNHSSTALWHAC